jgi:integrase
MQGYIKSRSAGSWSIAIYLGLDANGKKKYKWSTIHGTKKQAEAELTRLLHEVNTGSYLEPSKLTVADFLDRWLLDYAAAAMRPNTLALYKSIVGKQIKPQLGRLSLAKLSTLDLQQYYAWALKSGRADKKGLGKPLSPASVKKHHNLIHRALGHAVKWGLVGKNVADAVDAPKVERPEKHPLSAEDVLRFLDAAVKTDRYALYLAAITTGMRRGELLGLRWKDVDLEIGMAYVSRTLKVNKTDSGQTKTANSTRPVAISPETVTALKTHKARQNEDRLKSGPDYADHGLVFTVSGGNPINARNLVRQYKSLLKNAELPQSTRFHDLRHTYATLSLKQNVHPLKVSVQLGHKTPAFTMRQYQDVLPIMQQDAVAEIDALLFGRKPQPPLQAGTSPRD